ncbi:MAG: hypothetical protein AAGA85_09055 [Bacteroidota bacterium]
MRYLTVFVLVLGGALGLLAQTLPEQEQVYIKYFDGSIYIGTVVEREAYSIRVRIATQDTINVQYSLMKKMLSGSDLMIFPGGKYHLKTGLYLFSTGGAGGTDDGAITGQWDIVGGYRLTEDLHVGAGLGTEGGDIQIAGFWYSQSFTSLFGYGRYYPLGRSKARPYFDTRLGYGMPRNQWDGDHTGGFHFQPGIGVEFASRNNFRFLISVSQYVQNTRGEATEFGPFSQQVENRYNVWYNRTLFKIGLQFK